jgi:hypothetical protein
MCGGVSQKLSLSLLTIVVTSLQLLAVYISPLARVLDTVRPTGTDWLVVILCSVVPILIVEATKAVGRLKSAPIGGRSLEAN